MKHEKRSSSVTDDQGVTGDGLKELSEYLGVVYGRSEKDVP